MDQDLQGIQQSLKAIDRELLLWKKKPRKAPDPQRFGLLPPEHFLRSMRDGLKHLQRAHNRVKDLDREIRRCRKAIDREFYLLSKRKAWDDLFNKQLRGQVSLII